MKKTIALTALILSACTTTTEPQIGENVSAVNPVSMCPSPMPANTANLAPPAGQELKAAYAATGYQIYQCNGTAWAFQYPSANLLDQNGRVVGTHFKGPTWEFQDGSRVVGMKLQAATVDKTAIPWLLLKATSNTDSPDGDGRFADVTYVQRLSTTAGLAPSDACTSANVGQLIGTPYTAVYFFYHAGDNDSRRCQ
jgi:hypothetical protein